MICPAPRGKPLTANRRSAPADPLKEAGFAENFFAKNRIGEKTPSRKAIFAKSRLRENRLPEKPP
jgi:hypothetical protein